MYDLNFINIPFLVIFLYLVTELSKKFFIKTNKMRSFLPFISAIIGCILGGILHRHFPYVLNASHYFEALAVGAMSGLTATGCNQIFKQTKYFMNSEVSAYDEESDIINAKIRKMKSEIEYMQVKYTLDKVKKQKEVGIPFDFPDDMIGGNIIDGSQGEETYENNDDGNESVVG